MADVEYKNLLYELGKELNNDPEVELERLKYICGKKISRETRGDISDVLVLFERLEEGGNLGIDNLSFLKRILKVLRKDHLLAKVVAFEDAVAATGERESYEDALEQGDDGKGAEI